VTYFSFGSIDSIDNFNYKAAVCDGTVNNEYNNNNNHRFTATIQVNLRWPAPLVKNCRILLVQSFTARMPFLTATSAFGLERRR